MRSKLAALPLVVLLLPIDLVVVIALFVAQLCASFRKPLQPPALSDEVRRSATLVVLNWDGKHLLAECLPSLIEAAKYAGEKYEILVVDNGSTDGSVAFIKDHFPEVQILALNRNYGFGGGNNRAAEEIRTDIVVFVNNDMLVERDFLKPLLEGLQESSVFAVTSQVFFAEPTRRREETGKTRARFERGFFYFWHDEIQPSEENCKT